MSTKAPTRPAVDRTTLSVLLLTVFVAQLGVGVIVPIVPIYAAALGATGTALGVMVAVFSLTRGLAQPIVGGLADRIDRKRLLEVGLVLFALTGLSYVIADSITDLIVIRALHGAGSAILVPVAMAYIGDLSPEGHEGRYMGWLNVAIFTGIGAGPMLGGLILDAFGRNAAFYAMSGLSLVAAGLVTILLPRMAARPEIERVGMIQTFQRLLRSRRVRAILLSRMTTMFVLVPTMAFLPLLIATYRDVSGAHIGLVITVRTLMTAVLQAPFGRWVDRMDRGTLVAVGGVGMGIGMAGLAAARSDSVLLGTFAFLGAAEAMVWATLGALATEEGRIHGQGSVMGAFNFAISIGIFAASTLVGAMVDLMGVRPAIAAVGVGCGALFLVSWRMLLDPEIDLTRDAKPSVAEPSLEGVPGVFE